jgi:hypothetical protein
MQPAAPRPCVFMLQVPHACAVCTAFRACSHISLPWDVRLTRRGSHRRADVTVAALARSGAAAPSKAASPPCATSSVLGPRSRGPGRCPPSRQHQQGRWMDMRAHMYVRVCEGGGGKWMVIPMRRQSSHSTNQKTSQACCAPASNMPPSAPHARPARSPAAADSPSFRPTNAYSHSGNGVDGVDHQRGAAVQ